MILITGATGYIGRHLIARLVEQGERPRGLVRDIKRAESILPADKVELALGDTTQPASLAAATLVAKVAKTLGKPQTTLAHRCRSRPQPHACMPIGSEKPRSEKRHDPGRNAHHQDGR